jgi:outer membrane receptor for monomeric catechols
MSYFDIDRSNIPRQVTIFDPITGNRAGERTFLSGIENSSGFDGDIIYSPWDNWQNFFSFSFLETQLVSDETNPAREGGQLGGAPGTQLSFLSRYSFNEGPLDGFAVGMGVTYMQEVTNMFARYNIDYKDYDLTLMFNIHNLFDVDKVERNQAFLEARTFKGGVRIGF